MSAWSTQTVESAGVELHVVEGGLQNSETNSGSILFLHGFPDDHSIWYRQFEALCAEYHVITFDMRGVGKSSTCESDDAYRIESLLPDVEAVINATCGKKGKVHLVGHDWGSVIGWSFVFEPKYASRVLSWTSMSGPHLGIVWHHAKLDLKSCSPKKLWSAVRQTAHSWYIFSMFVPSLWERLLLPTSKLWSAHFVYSDARLEEDVALPLMGENLAARASQPLALYRKNFFRPPALPDRHACQIPTQVLIATRDRFLLPDLFSNFCHYVKNIRFARLDAGHWMQVTHSELIAERIGEFIKQNRAQIGALM